jgi:hypothetical protein
LRVERLEHWNLMIDDDAVTTITILRERQLHEPHYKLCHAMKFLRSLATTPKDSKGVGYGWSSFGRRQAQIAHSKNGDANNSRSTATLETKMRLVKSNRKEKSADESRDERSGDSSKHSYSTESTSSASLTGDLSGDSSDSKEHDQQFNNFSDFQGNFDEILNCGSAESYFVTLSDDRDESQESHEDVESNQFYEMPEGNAGRDASEGSFSYDSHPRPPKCTLSSNTVNGTTQPELPLVTRPRPKASTLRDLRKTQSEDSKHYVHVFHEQLHTLFEESDCEDEGSVDDGYLSDESFGDDFSMGAVHMKHYINESVVDDERLRERWNYSKELMSKAGNGQTQNKE